MSLCHRRLIFVNKWEFPLLFRDSPISCLTKWSYLCTRQSEGPDHYNTGIKVKREYTHTYLEHTHRDTTQGRDKKKGATAVAQQENTNI